MLSDTTIDSELSQFCEIRSGTVIKNLQRRNLDGCFVSNQQEALQLAMTLIPPEAVVGRGDSVTLNQIGVIPEMLKRNENRIINPVQADAEGHPPPREERRKLQQEAL